MHTHARRRRRWLRIALAGVVACLPLGWGVATVAPVYAAGPALDVKVSQDYPGSSNTLVAPVMSTAGPNEVIVVFAGEDGATPTVTSVTGGGLAFTMARRSNAGPDGTAEIWTAVAAAQLSSVAFTAHMSLITQATITAAAFTGVDIGNPVGASGANYVANGVTATETVAVTPAHSGSIIWAFGFETWGGGGRTAAGGQVMQHDYENSINADAGWVQSVTATTTAGTPVTVTTTTTGAVTDGFNYVAVELPPCCSALATSGTTFVANYTGNSITEYAAGVSGNALPVATISGSNTLLSGPDGLAFDAAGTLYVANGIGNTVTEYGVGMSGNIAPVRTITGASTALHGPGGVAFDAAGTLYVSNSSGVNTVTEYAPGINGNIAPIRTITGASTALNLPAGVALDAAGTLYVINKTGNTVTEYAAGINGNIAPIRTITGGSTGLVTPFGLGFDGSGTLYAANTDAATNSVTEYAAGVNGNIAPVRAVAGSNTTLNGPNGVAFDSAGILYVSSWGGPGSVTEFAVGANGNITPLRTIAGGSTGLNNPIGIAVFPAPSAAQTFTETAGPGSLSITAPANATLTAQNPGTTPAALAMGAMSFTDTLNDSSVWSVTLAATDFGAAKIPFTNLTIGVTTAANYTAQGGDIGTPTAGTASQTLAGTDGSPGVTFSTAITLASALGGNAVEGTWTTPSGTTGNTITETVPASTTAGTYTSTFQYTITG